MTVLFHDSAATLDGKTTKMSPGTATHSQAESDRTPASQHVALDLLERGDPTNRELQGRQCALDVAILARETDLSRNVLYDALEDMRFELEGAQRTFTGTCPHHRRAFQKKAASCAESSRTLSPTSSNPLRKIRPSSNASPGLTASLPLQKGELTEYSAANGLHRILLYRAAS